MKRSTDRILTSHTGALHLPTDLQEVIADEWTGNAKDPGAIDARLREAVGEVVRKQADLGVDIVNDGEFSKSSWMGYATERISGLTFTQADGEIDMGEAFAGQSKDQQDFADFYVEAGNTLMFVEPAAEEAFQVAARSETAVVTGPIEYSGQEVLDRDIDNLKAALGTANVEEAFMAVVAPSSVQAWLKNEHYANDEDMLGALAAALRHEYRAIIDAGFIVQIDDAFLPTEWDRWLAEGTGGVKKFREWADLAVHALNDALEGLPADRVRYHVCWGSWNGPHSTDIPLRDIVDLILKVNAQTYSLEAANARHEWEFRVWEDVKLPDGKILMPGVIEHATNVVEHPETVAERILRFANILGRENVIAGTDCGMRFRAHPQVAWAKLRALSEGAQLASQRLWT